jgi:hypothetical protein
MLLPAAMSGKERREKMAIMETAISSSLSHPNIVQVWHSLADPTFCTCCGLLHRRLCRQKH